MAPPAQGGLPLWTAGAHPGSGLSSITRSRSGFFASPPKRPRAGGGGGGAAARLVRHALLACFGLLLLGVLVLQVRLIRADGGAPLDRGDRGGDGADAADGAVEAPAAGYPAPQLTHLVLVAGHAVYTGVDYALATKESSWFLEAYQQVPGQAQTLLDHIKLGIETAAADPSALLLFSGGQTRQAAGPRSEGLSYWMVAEAAGWFGLTDVRMRAFTEEHARDSFENVLFSLCRFFELTGHYPARITAVSYSLKQQRFEQLHRAAVRFPAAAFTFLGTPVPAEATGAAAGEAATVAAFQRDPFGCSGALLAKKARRDPFAVGPPHPSRCPAMAELLKYCSPKGQPFPGRVPWALLEEGGGAGERKRGGLLHAKRRSSRSGIYT
ncbi:SPAC57A10.07 [Scenedesmus sp. PABB004]|nr:SPAC57A10.07 [Scenedesmus sp. PABB004]